jgi:4'-phosphopantetheinyl transferase
MTPLAPHEVHLWLGATSGEALARLPCAWSLLDEAERARAARFLVEHARTEYILSHGLVRACLAEHTGADPRDFRFRTAAHGKPSIAAPAHLAQVHFNLSHSRGVAALAVAFGREVGVDVEQKSERVEIETLAQTVFSESGLRAFAALPPERRRDWFFAKWTLKEALVKARGDGLSLDVQRIRVDFREDLGAAQTWLDGQDVSARFRIFPFQPTPDHAGTLVVEARPDEPISVVDHGFGAPGRAAGAPGA